MNLRKWFNEHSLKLLAIRDTPNAIAGGVAIGIFFGFTPLVGLKTLLSIFVAWLTRCNILAAAIAVTLHDVALPFMPVLFRWEYNIGYWLLSDPHHWPERLRSALAGAGVAELDDFFFSRSSVAVGVGDRERAGGPGDLLVGAQHCDRASQEASARSSSRAAQPAA